MSPRPLIDISRLTQQLNPKIELAPHKVTMSDVNSARAVAEFIYRLHENHMDYVMAIGCAAFSMSVLAGVYVLLDSL